MSRPHLVYERLVEYDNVTAWSNLISMRAETTQIAVYTINSLQSFQTRCKIHENISTKEKDTLPCTGVVGSEGKRNGIL